jgi:hypothetical protein
MFVGDPQPVEIHHRGIWYSGELIGWRHGDDGRVLARVRCTVDRLRHSAWKDLTELRLPDPAHPPRSEPFPAVIRRAASLAPEDDETRPHALLAALRTGPRKPVHAMSPPPRRTPVPLPRLEPARRDERRAAARTWAGRPGALDGARLTSV